MPFFRVATGIFRVRHLRTFTPSAVAWPRASPLASPHCRLGFMLPAEPGVIQTEWNHLYNMPGTQRSPRGHSLPTRLG